MYNYISIREVLSRVLRHPLLQDVTLEQAVQYTLDFIETFGMPKMFQDAEAEIHISDYRGMIPCDASYVIQVKNKHNNKCLRSTTDNFDPIKDRRFKPEIYPAEVMVEEDTFKLQGRVIYTSFKEGDIIISYKSIPVDKDGFPMIIEHASFLKALESYIKKEVFTILYDLGKISAAVMTNTQQDYAWRAAQCRSEFNTPSLSEMQSIANSWNTLLERPREFYSGFKNNGNQEYIKQH